MTDDRDTETRTVGAGAVIDPPAHVPPRWRLVRGLGRGGQAEVWLAEDQRLGERVALKLFGAPSGRSSRARWLREVRLGRSLQHPNLLRLYDVVDLDDGAMAVMELVGGGTLGERIQAHGPVPVSEAVRLVEAMLEVLGYLHDHGIVHRDVKPSNILFTEHGVPKLGDLGLVRELDAGSDLTATRTAVGTPAYMSPEQIRGEDPQPSWDLYALGVTLYEALTGSPPFHATSSYEIADAHLHQCPTGVRRSRPDCPRWLARLVTRLLEKRAEDRWPDAGTALTALRRKRVARSPRAWRRGGIWIAASAAVVSIGVLGTLFLSGPPDLADVSVMSRDVVGRDATGDELWRHPIPSTHAFARRGNFLPGDRPEVILAAVDESIEPPKLPIALELLSDRGESLGAWRLNRPRQWPYRSSDWMFEQLIPGDLDGDGVDEAVLVTHHRLWYPSQLVLWRGAGDRPHWTPAFSNSGALHAARLVDLNHDGIRDILTAGLNNPIGYQIVVAALDGRSLLEHGGALSPDLTMGSGQGTPHRSRQPLFFTPLGSTHRTKTGRYPVAARGQRIRLPLQNETVELDTDGNPVGSALAGGGPEPRCGFWRDLSLACNEVSTTPADWTGEWRGLTHAHAAALQEPPMRTAAALLFARALADERAYAGACEVLQETVRDVPRERDLWLRLGEYNLIAGWRSAGRRALLEAAKPVQGGRNIYDAFVLLSLDAAVHVDPEAIDTASRVFQRGSGSENDRLRDAMYPVLWFCRGSWRDPRFDELAKTDVLPFVRWLSPWVRLHNGADPSAVLSDVRGTLATSDAPALGRVLEAEALRRTGRVEDALAAADEALRELEIRGRRSYEAFAWVPLAAWETGVCLADLGRTDRAQTHLGRAARMSPKTWYGRDAARRLESLK